MPGTYTTLPQFTAGQLVTESHLNAILANLAAMKNDHMTAGGRITLVSGVPVPIADVTTPVTSILYTPYRGNLIGLYDGTIWHVRQFSELTLSIASDGATGDVVYDLFAYFNTSTGQVTLERLQWANFSTRATGLSWLDGVLVKSGTPTRRYLGTYMLNSLGSIIDTVDRRLVWNYYNRVRRTLRYIHPATSWTYTLAANRAVGGGAGNQVMTVVGWQDVMIDLLLLAQGSNTGPVTLQVSIGEYAVGSDGGTTAAAECIFTQGSAEGTGRPANPSARLVKQAPIGASYYSWLELSEAVGTTTWLGLFTGLSGSIEG
jgi:hypothetical protein